MITTYQELKKEFLNHLDNSQDTNTLLLEVMPIIYTVMRDAYIPSEYREQIYDSIRTIWDIAYNYGFHDAITETSPKNSLNYDDIM